MKTNPPEKVRRTHETRRTGAAFCFVLFVAMTVAYGQEAAPAALPPGTAKQDEPHRSCVIVNSSGIEFATTTLEFSSGITRIMPPSDTTAENGYIFQYPSGYREAAVLVIQTGTFMIAMLPEHVISIEKSTDAGGDRFDVTHRWEGKRRTVSGAIVGTIIGDSDFGQVKISADQLQQVTCADAPSPSSLSGYTQGEVDKALSTATATLRTTEGSEVPVTVRTRSLLVSKRALSRSPLAAQ